MTIHEALQRIKSTRYSFVVWNSSEASIAEVIDDGDGQFTLERHEKHRAFVNQFPFDTSSETIGSTVTAEYLESQAEDFRAAVRRQNAMRAWGNASCEQLVEALMTGVYGDSLKKGDADVLMRNLFHLHADELETASIGLLRKLTAFSQDREAMNRTGLSEELTALLRMYLARDPQELSLAHNEIRDDMKSMADVFRYLEILGDLRSHDASSIRDLIKWLSSGPFFAGVRLGMLGLGKIGPAAGKEAIDELRRRVYDSSEKVTDMRERVIARISATPGQWIICCECHRGRIPDVPWPSDCPKCLGLGFVDRASAHEEVRAERRPVHIISIGRAVPEQIPQSGGEKAGQFPGSWELPRNVESPSSWELAKKYAGFPSASSDGI